MSEDLVQLCLALFETCIQCEGQGTKRILPWRSFKNPDKRNKAAKFLEDMNYVSITRKGVVINPIYRNLGGLKKELENKYRTTLQIPLLPLAPNSPKGANTTKNSFDPSKPKRKKAGSLSSATKPLPKFSSIAPINKTIYPVDTVAHKPPGEFTLVRQTFGSFESEERSKHYMGVVKFFGVNLPIIHGTLVTPIAVKTVLEEHQHAELQDDNSASGENFFSMEEDEFESEGDRGSEPDEESIEEGEELSSDNIPRSLPTFV